MKPDEFESPFLRVELPPSSSEDGPREVPADFEEQFDALFSDEADEASPTDEAPSTDEAAFMNEASPIDEAGSTDEVRSIDEVRSVDEASEAEAEPEADVAGETEVGYPRDEALITPGLPTGEGEGTFPSGEDETSNDELSEVIATEQEEEGPVVLLAEDESGSDNEQVVVLNEEAADLEDEVRPAPSPVRARILWPALGFPAVIAPRTPGSVSPMSDGDATRCITVLLLSDRRNLSKAEAAAYLRYVQWEQRGRRHIQPGQAGAFKEEELAVRNNEAGPKLVLPTPKQSLGVLVAFGGDRDGKNAITVNLANKVLQLHAKAGLRYLHEIRVNEGTSAQLGEGQFHLFWNNQIAKEGVPSDEMALLIKEHATPLRQKLGEVWEKEENYLLKEYEMEYGLLHPPYATQLAMRTPRAEVLHPLFVQRQASSQLRIGHLTDLHVDVRADVYEENLKRGEKARRNQGKKIHSYNSTNRSFAKLYNDAQKDADVVFLTGDLIDYGRGHWGIPAGDRLAEDTAYHEDRNWFLLYYLLASGNSYRRPVYSILGNHDWRLNPYPPFAIGAPEGSALFHDYRPNASDEFKESLRLAHGPGHERKFSYFSKANSVLDLFHLNTGDALKALWTIAKQGRTLDEKHAPTETTVESVAWYLFTINPFLDYSFSLPGRHQILMLDWAENEDVLFPMTKQGGEWMHMVWEAGDAAFDGPKARDSLTDLQMRMVSDFVERPGTAKIVGIHAPPIGPYPTWTDQDLIAGRKTYDSKKDARGPTNYGTKRPDGTVEAWNGHPIFAVRPKNGAAGMAADYNSLGRKRDWFIGQLTNPKSGVRVVLAGHIHRNGLFVVHVPGKEQGAAVAGELLVRGVKPQFVASAPPPAVTVTPEGKRGPLFVNTTTAGFRGDEFPAEGKKVSIAPGYAHVALLSDGTVQQVEFRPKQAAQVTATQAAPSAHEAAEAI